MLNDPNAMKPVSNRAKRRKQIRNVKHNLGELRAKQNIHAQRTKKGKGK